MKIGSHMDNQKQSYERIEIMKNVVNDTNIVEAQEEKRNVVKMPIEKQEGMSQLDKAGIEEFSEFILEDEVEEAIYWSCVNAFDEGAIQRW